MTLYFVRYDFLLDYVLGSIFIKPQIEFMRLQFLDINYDVLHCKCEIIIGIFFLNNSFRESSYVSAFTRVVLIC